MSEENHSDSGASSPASSAPSEARQASSEQTASVRKKASKKTKPRLTATQKNTNHKDAENKRRNAIRERFTDLSQMVPGAEGQERSEQVMLGKTTEFLKHLLEEQRRLEAMAAAQGVYLDESEKLKDTDYGGPNWQPANMEAYEAAKIKKPGPSSQDGKAGEDG